MTSDFVGEVDDIVAPTLRGFGLTPDGIFDGFDNGGRRLAICFFRGSDCKLQIYSWEREGETNCMIAPAYAANEFGPLSKSKRWQFLTKFVARPDLPLDELARAARVDFESHALPLQWVKARIEACYPEARDGVLAMRSRQPGMMNSTTDMPVTGADGIYRGQRYRMLFGNNDWVALRADSDAEMPDAFARTERFAKVPAAVVDGVIEVWVRGTVRGETVSLQRQLPDGRVSVGFVGSPDAAAELGLDGDQHMGWTGVFAPEEIGFIHVLETRRA